MHASHRFALVAALVTLVAALVLGSSLPALAFPRLPLREGEFTRGACRAKPDGSLSVPDLSESIGVYGVQDVPKPYQFLSPVAEDQTGYCKIKSFKTAGKRVSGRAACEDGGSRIRYSSGTYSFDYEIINAQAFVSHGVTYTWCSPHR